MKPRVRIAPSPTGNLHIGTARTSLFNFLHARKHNGVFIVRVEDTDRARSTKEYEENIIEGLTWLQLTWDEFYRQSEREDTYRAYLKKMIEGGTAYVSKETPKEEGDRDEVIRFKNPNTKIEFDDVIRGKVSFDTTELGDFIIARSLEEPLYHLAVVVDDHEMKISHVIRGEDHISNTPRQILIQQAIGAERPIYAHLPLILGKDRSKLSKRHGATSIDEYRNAGYRPEAIVNYLALLGWNPGTEKEIFTIEELSKEFSIEKIQKGGAIFDEEKLKWINEEHKKILIEKGSIDPQEDSQKAIERVYGGNVTPEARRLTWGLILASGAQNSTVATQEAFIKDSDFAGYVLKEPEYEVSKLKWKDEKDLEGVLRHLKQIHEVLEALDEKDFKKEYIKEKIWPYAEKEGRGNVLWPMRYAISGKDRSPDPFVLSEIFGKEIVLKRIKVAIEKVSNA